MKQALLFIFFLGYIYGNAQNQLTSYPLPTGYTSNQLIGRNALHVDAANNKWIGFRTIGLGRFDGNTWTMFDSLNSTLPSNNVFALASTTTTLWVGTFAGLSKFDGITFTNFDTANSPLPYGGVPVVAVNGNEVWAGTNKGVYKYDGVTWVNYSTVNSGIVGDTIQCITFDHLNNAWIGTKNGLSYFANNSFTNYTTSNSNLDTNAILCVTITNNNDVWVGTKGTGAYKLVNGDFVSTAGLILDHVYDCAYDPFFYANIYAIAKDSASNVYFVLTKNGVNDFLKVTGSQGWKFSLADSIGGNLSAQRVLIQTDANGTMWITGAPNFYSSKLYSINLSALTLSNIEDNVLLGKNDLNINLVKAPINNVGDMFVYYPFSSSGYEVPICSGKSSVYVASLWLGGLDQNNNLHVAAMTYRQGGVDYWPGPLDTTTCSSDSVTTALYDRLWKINKSMLYHFQQNFLNGNVGNGTYLIPEPILSWPAQGTGNYSRKLAPFVDYNSDGIYNPYDGDYPEITGDQMLWWVFNDTLATHKESDGAAFGFEIHGKAYAYTCPAISTAFEVINYTTFYQYKIINRSLNTYHDMFIGLWTDNDLGNAIDDFVGCDTMLDASFAYNGDNDDEGYGGYGLNPPMQNTMILQGPLADINDGLDNNHNGTTDEAGETIGMSNFLYYNGMGGVPDGRPTTPDDYYQYLDGIWLDGLQMTYGGTGRDLNSTNYCNHMFPGTPYDTGWTETSAGNVPEDRRSLMSSGAFTIAPGEERTIDFAYVFTRDSTAPNGLTTSVAKNKADLLLVRQWFDNNSFPSCYTIGVNESKPLESVLVYPNPATTFLQLKNVSATRKLHYIISDITGRICLQGIYKDAIDISKLKTQLYLLQLNDGIKKSYAKFVKW